MKYPRENITAEAQHIDVKVQSEDEIGAINAAFINNGVSLLGVTKLEQRLEDIFIELTSEGGGQIA